MAAKSKRAVERLPFKKMEIKRRTVQKSTAEAYSLQSGHVEENDAPRRPWRGVCAGESRPLPAR